MVSFELTPDLAEICGIHAGDGYMRKRNSGSTEIDISGGIDEKGYYDNWVVPLFNKVFEIELKPRFFPHRNTYGFVIYDTKIAEFIHSLGFPFGKKTLTVAVPDFIQKSRDLDIIYRFIRGLFDTDGSISFRNRAGSGYAPFYRKRHTYPSISLGICSRNLWIGVCKLLMKTGFQFTVSHQQANKKENPKYKITLRGDASVINWVNNIGFNNPLKFNRFLIWKKFGFVPPHLSFKEQSEILEGKNDPGSFYQETLLAGENLAPLLVKKRLKVAEALDSFYS